MKASDLSRGRPARQFALRFARYPAMVHREHRRAHVHHLCSRIPYYRLPRALRDHHELGGVTRLTLLQSLRCVRLVLWDEDQRRLVSFQRVRLPERAETLPVPLTRRLPLQSRGAAVVGGTDLNVNTIVETKLSLRACLDELREDWARAE